MALSTDDTTFTLITEATPTEAPPTPRPPRRRNHVLGWIGVGIALLAVAALAVAVLRADSPTSVDDNARTVARHGSVAAIDHRDLAVVASRRNSPSQTVAGHGSVAAIDHHDPG